jgi:hypothetical protein
VESLIPFALVCGTAAIVCDLATERRSSPSPLPIRGRGGSSGTSFRCRFDDGSGQLDLLFIGRARVPGLVAGTRCTLEGTVRTEGTLFVVWNPLYRIDDPARHSTSLEAT